MRRVSPLLVVVVFPFVPPALAQSAPPPAVTGRVTDATGLPLVGAQVAVAPAGGGVSRLVYRPEAGRVVRAGVTWRWERRQ